MRPLGVEPADVRRQLAPHGGEVFEDEQRRGDSRFKDPKKRSMIATDCHLPTAPYPLRPDVIHILQASSPSFSRSATCSRRTSSRRP